MLDRLILFETVRKDAICTRLAPLAYKESGQHSADSAEQIFYETQRALLHHLGRGEISGNYLQDYLCRLIGSEDNIFALMSEKGIFEDTGAGFNTEARTVLKLAADEIEIISALYHFDFGKIIDTTGRQDFTAAPAAPKATVSHREQIHQAMSQENSADAAILLAGHYRSYGSGIFESASAFDAADQGLVPVRRKDPIGMDDIVGYERQKQILIENTDILLAGLKANNVLLYGDSGTGKSSSVKALLNRYASRGLKMISVSKDKLRLLPDIIERIEDRGMKFIIFIDDLSFEENEFEYKTFKSVIEGRVTQRPENTIFIVTSNRKNIVKEIWADREGRDDVRLRDNLEEKRSLSDRFGITLVYAAPNKQEYLNIVRDMADKSGLSMPDEELEAEALKWEIQHGGRSGRAARQFVDYMAGVRR